MNSPEIPSAEEVPNDPPDDNPTPLALASKAAQYATLNRFVNTKESQNAFKNTLFTPKLAEKDLYEETEIYGKDVMDDIKNTLDADINSGIHINIIDSIKTYFLNNNEHSQKTEFISLMINRMTETITELTG